MSSYLADVELFAGLAPEQLERIAQAAHPRVFMPGSIIVNEGDEGHGLFVIQSGSLKVFLVEENGRELTLSLLWPGEYFGELALLDSAPRSASVMTRERTELLHISHTAFMALLEQHPGCAHVVMKNLVGRIRTLTDNVRGLALNDVFGRLVRLFETLAVAHEGKRVVERRLTQQEIANLLGASREMVNRILRELVVGGYLNLDDHRITLLKPLPTRW
ncbi:MAG TPA: Crp/Fnr family transcriptional regulator [Rhodocyclaceae bacterium]|nr:Crp/Fnr family transcriptional regulator [Zoogloeaceae bacterium]HRD35455.1 Crp/Fnr family transcriptional regulator [Rhodocyclaceae bacterium]